MKIERNSMYGVFYTVHTHIKYSVTVTNDNFQKSVFLLLSQVILLSCNSNYGS